MGVWAKSVPDSSSAKALRHSHSWLVSGTGRLEQKEQEGLWWGGRSGHEAPIRKTILSATRSLWRALNRKAA